MDKQKFFRLLKEQGVYQVYKKYVEAEMKKYDCFETVMKRNGYVPLDVAFDWSKTKEGKPFWERIQDLIRRENGIKN